MKKILIVMVMVFTATFANAVSLCDNGTPEACARAIENFYLKTYAEIYQSKDSPLSQDEFVKKLKEAIGPGQFQDLYQECTKSTDSRDVALSCINKGFKSLLTHKEGNNEVEQFIRDTLPDIVLTWDEDTFQKNAVSYFPMDTYSSISKMAKLLFGKCEVKDIEEQNRKFEMTYGLVIYNYVANLICEKMKHPKAEISISKENGAWKYRVMNVNERVEIDLNK